ACSAVLRDLHSFPTRRSSDLACSGAYLTRDLFNLYVWFEVLLVSTLLIIAVETGDKGRPAWRGYLTINLLSSILFILGIAFVFRSEEHTSELQSRENLVCRLL